MLTRERRDEIVRELLDHAGDLTVEYARCVPKRLLREAADALRTLPVGEGKDIYEPDPGVTWVNEDGSGGGGIWPTPDEPIEPPEGCTIVKRATPTTADRSEEIVTEMQDVYDLIIATCQDDPEFKARGASALRFLNRLEDALATFKLKGR